MNFQMFNLDLEMAEEPEIKLSSVASWKNQKSSKNTSASALLIVSKPLTVWITMNCGKCLKEMGIANRLTCLLRNLYAGKETAVITGHATTDLFQIGKGVCQGYILSPC